MDRVQFDRRGRHRWNRRGLQRRYNDGRDRQWLTPFDDHRQRAGPDVGLESVAHASRHRVLFPVVQDRCAQNNDA